MQRRQSLFRFLAMLASFTIPLVSAQETESVGTQTVSSTARVKIVEPPVPLHEDVDPVMVPPPRLAEPESDPGFRDRAQSIRNYNNSLADIELEGGAWDPMLVEELVSLGQIFQQQGQHNEAIDTFNRAIHINRIHSGLHTLEQIPAVEEMIDSYLAVGDWQQADVYYDYLFYVQHKAYGIHDPRIVPVLDSLAKWNIQAFNIGFSESRGVRLSNAQLLFSTAARIVRTHFGDDDERFVRYKRNLADSAYLLSRNPEAQQDMDRPDVRTAQDLLRTKLNQRGSVQPLGFPVGENALLDVIDYYQQQADRQWEYAEAITHLGDWYLLFQRRTAAAAKYREAWQILSEMENSAELQQQLFGTVESLPSFANDIDSELTQVVANQESAPLNYGYVDMAFDVTRNGVVRNIRILSEETGANSNQVSRVRRIIRNSYYRPVLEDGEPVRSNNHQFRYGYWY